jgi:hypothetical protein
MAPTGQTGVHSAQPVQAPASTRGRAPPKAKANRMAPVGQASRQVMQAMPLKARQASVMMAMGLVVGGSEGGVDLPNRSLRRPRPGAASEATAGPLTPAPAGR